MKSTIRLAIFACAVAVCLAATTVAFAGQGSQNWDTPEGDAPDNPVNFTHRFDFGANISCRMWKDCEQGYRLFLLRTVDDPRPVPWSKIEKAVRKTWTGSAEVLTAALPEDELRDRLLDTLNIRELVEGLDARAHVATYVQSKRNKFFVEYRLFISGPLIGTFEALLLVPHGAGPFPAIVAAHGHGDNAKSFRDFYYGSYYARHGYVVLIPTFRVDDADEYEDQLSRDFLQQGFALADMRIYETLLCHKLLRSLPIVNADRIGLIGHSGGSANSNVAIRIEPRFAAYVSDHTHTWSANPDDPYYDGVVPALYPYHALINDFSTSSVPVLRVPYEFTDGPTGILQFFDEHLKN
ncbi:MAG: acetylxylan esterase [Deltaproteobacteria bacterium]|nr:acetylxylan esterase [Deltaproteobacteria bacterium]